MRDKDTDLRVIKTRRAIREALCDMIMEMDYHDITIKELVDRAMINRNTFYNHYSSIDALLEELQDEIVDDYIAMFTSYENIEDVEKMIKNLCEYVVSRSPLQERIFCCGSYRFVAEAINEKISSHQKQLRRGIFGMSEAAEDIVLAYCGSVGAIIFRQWISSGKKLPLDELISLSTKLICKGMESVINK